MSSQTAATRRVLSELNINTPNNTSPSMADLKGKGNSPSKAGLAMGKCIIHTPGEKRAMKEVTGHVEKDGSNKRFKSAHDQTDIDSRSGDTPEHTHGSNCAAVPWSKRIYAATEASPNASQLLSSPGSSMSPVSSNGTFV